LAKRKNSDANCLSPKGEFWHCLEQALDLSKNVSEQAKRDLGNSLSRLHSAKLLSTEPGHENHKT
jgi:hypothetical protein